MYGTTRQVSPLNASVGWILRARRLGGLSRLLEQRFDECGQCLLAQVPWVVPLNNAIAIDEDERRRRTDAEVEEVAGANRYPHPRRDRILRLVVAVEIRQFLVGRRRLHAPLGG